LPPLFQAAFSENQQNVLKNDGTNPPANLFNLQENDEENSMNIVAKKDFQPEASS